MDEISDGKILGQDINGTLHGAPVLTPDGRKGHALHVVGNLQSVSVSSESNPCLGFPQYCPHGQTLMMWLKVYGRYNCTDNTEFLYVFRSDSPNHYHMGISGYFTPGFFRVKYKTSSNLWWFKVKEEAIPLNK